MLQGYANGDQWCWPVATTVGVMDVGDCNEAYYCNRAIKLGALRDFVDGYRLQVRAYCCCLAVYDVCR